MKDPVQDARKAVEASLEAFKASGTYATARALQKAQRALETAAIDKRKDFSVIEGDAGLNFSTEEEVTTSALKRIIVEIESTEDKYDRTLLYVHKLATQALKEAGRG